MVHAVPVRTERAWMEPRYRPGRAGWGPAAAGLQFPQPANAPEKQAATMATDCATSSFVVHGFSPREVRFMRKPRFAWNR